ncbi:CopD family protein [Candidatus Microthrix parvicella]|uniref:copper resistance CopC/CopD family protein n=1 Tax=Candidatus Neomicrothrix parvicella TaxID=41950 RepID=UPI0003767B9D|nr:CopD family protein [Candidatus Microthrix parvicella]
MNALRRRGLLVVMLGLAVSAVLGWATPAGAHADLISTTPTQGSTVVEAPPVLVMTYSERVKVSSDGVRLLDPTGTPVSGISASAKGPEVRIGIPDLTEQGTYTVDWKAVSADGHPLRGAWVFNLGVEGGGADVALGTTGQSPLIAALSAAGRSLAFVAMFVLAGQLLWAGVARWGPLAALAWAGTVLVVIAELWSAIAGGASGPVDALGTVLGTSSGRFLAATVLLVGYGHLMCALGRLDSRALGVVWTCAVVAAALVGHATVVDPVLLSIFGTVGHVTAAAIWVSALVWTAGVLPGPVRRWRLESAPGPGDDEEGERGAAGRDGNTPTPGCSATEGHWELLHRAIRFSPWGLGAVVVLLGTGVAMLLVRVHGPSGLVTSGYGLLGVAKLVVLAAAVALAARNKWWLIPRLARAFPGLAPEGADAKDAQRSARALQRAVQAEMVLLTVAVVLGGVLGATAPPPEVSAASNDPGTAVASDTFSDVADFGPYQAQIQMSPVRVGPTVAHVTVVDPTGPPPEDLSELTVSFALPSADLGPIEPELIELNPSHVIADDVPLTSPGEWMVTVDARRGTAEFLRATFQVDIGG